ncbi:MAG: adenylate/guanylate cyclase domain-containing protein [Rhodospirillaceae bacterium]|nr:adenylate/guanylate cyclase domain-containing protein [Rhodospirillaceae bacterium]
MRESGLTVKKGVRAFWSGVKKAIKPTVPRLIALAMLIGVVAVRVVDPVSLQMLRVRTFDVYQQIKPRPQTPGMVTIIDIDEESLKRLGQWPWPRTLVARLLDRLTEMRAAVVGFDVVFAEPDRMSPQNLADILPYLSDAAREDMKSRPSNDQVFAESIRRSRVVLGQTGMPFDRPLPSNMPRPSVAVLGNGLDRWVETHRGLLRNVPDIDQSAAGHGVFTVAGETDGVVRRVPMVLNVQDGYFPSLSLEMLRLAAGQKSILIKTRADIGIEGLRIRGLPPIRTDANGRVWVYFAKSNPEQYVSAYKVLDGTAPPESIANRLVLVGTSAAGLLDIKATPLSPFLPGVEVHAQILENILTNAQLQQPRDASGVEISFAVAIGLSMIILLPLIGARLTLVLFLGLAGGIGAWSWHAFAVQKVLYDPVLPSLTALLIFIFLTYTSYAKEEAERRHVRSAFSHYMSPALVERLAEDPSRLKLGGEMRDMTVLFCDVRGFTTISEQFDAEGLTRLINRFLTPMTGVILDRQGTIDKYMGDCIMAFWNAPLDDPEHEIHACESALDMIRALKTLNTALKEEAEQTGRTYIPIAVGVGINSGLVCVGNMGSEQRFDYSVMGDDVNLASRLEGQSKTYGVTTVVGENTEPKVRAFALLELDLIRVKGKTIPVRIFGLVGDRDLALTPEFVAHREIHDRLLAVYRAQKWDEAEVALALCRDSDIGHLVPKFYEMMAERISLFRTTPPGLAWDGVFVATSK